MMMIPRNHFGLGIFDEMFRDPFFTQSNSVMKTDIQQKNGNYEMDIDLPGFQKENINAQLENGYLTITANQDNCKDEKDEKGNYIYQERHTGKCSRTFYVGEMVTKEEMKAVFKDGTLHLTFPKKDEKQLESKTKYIAIE